MLGFTDADLKKSVFYQEVFAEGREEGQYNAVLALVLVLRQLRRRCGPLNETQTAQIESLSLPQLENLSEALLDVNDQADLLTWLQTQSPSNAS